MFNSLLFATLLVLAVVGCAMALHSHQVRQARKQDHLNAAFRRAQQRRLRYNFDY